MADNNDIYLCGVESHVYRQDIYDRYRVHVNHPNIPEGAIVATIEENHLIIQQNDVKICHLFPHPKNIVNFFTTDKQNLLDMLVRGNDGRTSLIYDRACMFCNIFHLIRYSTLYLKYPKIKIWNKIPGFEQYLIDEDMYELVDSRPFGQFIEFSGNLDNVTVKLFDSDGGRICKNFYINRFNVRQFANVIHGSLGTLRENTDAAYIHHIVEACEGHIIDGYSDMHRLLEDPRYTRVFNSLYRIGSRWLSANTH